MGIATPRTLQNKIRYKALIDHYCEYQSDALEKNLLDFLAPDAVINVAHPLNDIDGSAEFVSRVLKPMGNAFDHLHRRADMLFGGEFNGGEWVVSHGHYVGRFQRDWMGIPASNDIVWLHYAEYHRMADGRSVESYLYIDMLDFLRQIGRFPFRDSLGFEGFVAGPATGDGILVAAQDPAESTRSFELIENMLSRLYTEDEAWRPYWHRNMYWYGPSGYGSQIGIEGFNRFQKPYESVFDSERVRSAFLMSGNEELDTSVRGHYARFADGNYAALGGWPSHGGFLVNDWMGVKAQGQMFTVRVADLYRRQGDVLAENWVFVDVIDMLLQLGIDVFAEANINLRL